MSENNNTIPVVSKKKFAVMVGVYVLWLAYLAAVAVMRKMGC